jgi:hypothetical protein
VITNVHLVDGRTTFQFVSRGDMRKLLATTLGPQEEEPPPGPVTAWARWNPDDPTWVPIRLHFLRRGSIAFVLAAKDEAAQPSDLPAQSEAEERAARFAEREGS